MRMDEVEWDKGNKREYWAQSQALYHKIDRKKALAYKRIRCSGEIALDNNKWAIWYTEDKPMGETQLIYYQDIVDFTFELSYLEPLTPEGDHNDDADNRQST